MQRVIDVLQIQHRTRIQSVCVWKRKSEWNTIFSKYINTSNSLDQLLTVDTEPGSSRNCFRLRLFFPFTCQTKRLTLNHCNVCNMRLVTDFYNNLYKRNDISLNYSEKALSCPSLTIFLCTETRSQTEKI